MACQAQVFDGCNQSCCSTDTCKCLTVFNYAGEDVQLADKPNTGVVKTFSSANGSSGGITISIPPDLLSKGFWGKKSLKYYGPIPQTSKVYLNHTAFRKPLTTTKRFVFAIVAVFSIVCIAVCAVALNKAKEVAVENLCNSLHLSPEECASELALGMHKIKVSGKSSLIAFIVFSTLIFVACVVLWLWAFGPFSYASYSSCKKRKGFGNTWFYVEPRSSFRKFLCKAFGACECAADGLQQQCDSIGQYDGERDYKWDEDAAAKSKSSSNQNFCCFEGDCIKLDIS